MSSPPPPPLSPREIFNQTVPTELVDTSIRAILGGWDSAFQGGEQFAEEERRDVAGHLRRAHIEGRWRQLAPSVEGVTATAELTTGDTSYYTQVCVGSVIITQSCVNACNEKPRDARFRDAIAWTPQQVLFEDERPPVGSAAYAILLHGPRRSRDRQPEFIVVAFPSRDLTHFVDFIDLTHRMHELAAERIAETNAVVPVEEPNPALAAEETVADEDLQLNLRT